MAASRVALCVALMSLLAAACSGGSGGMAGAAVPAAATPRPTPVVRSSGTQGAIPCPISKPDPVFTAPPPSPAKPPDYYGSDWFGTADLYTMLRHGGEIWRHLPHNPDGLTQKTFWWSANWPFRVELEPDITVVGVRLDGPGRFEAGHPGTNASADFGVAMLVGVDIPSTGCWRLTATYRGAQLGYVVLVED